MGVMGAIAVCLASALPLAKAAEEGPESLITAPIQALEENNPKLIWEMLPASYQKDLNGLVQAFAKEMDAELWDAGFELAGSIGELLRTKKDLVAGAISQIGFDDLDLISGEVTIGADGPTPELISGLETAGTLLEKLREERPRHNGQTQNHRPWPSRRYAWQGYDYAHGGFGEGGGETDPFGLELLRGIKVEVVSEDGDNATIKVSRLPEAVDLGRWTELPGSLPPGLPGLPDDIENPFEAFSEFENGELELMKVEGKWVPKEAADGWTEAMSIAKEGLQGGLDIPAEDKRQALAVINGIRKGLNTAKMAKTPQQFQLALMGTMISLGAAAAGDTGGDVSPAQKAEARQLAQGEISLTNGDIIEGTVADVDQNGIVVRRDIGGFAQRAN